MRYKYVKGAAVIAGLLILCGAGPAGKLYKGNWFQVRYPSAFTAKKSTNDSAFFKSKDGSVEFYVFSPQWNGDPKDIALNAKKESVVAQSTQRKGDVVVRRRTIKANNGSYQRSVEDTEDTKLNTRKAFAIKYKNAKVLAKWRKEYLAFKKSLVQFAD
jgi:hypothetical protein